MRVIIIDCTDKKTAKRKNPQIIGSIRDLELGVVALLKHTDSMATRVTSRVIETSITGNKIIVETTNTIYRLEIQEN